MRAGKDGHQACGVPARSGTVYTAGQRRDAVCSRQDSIQETTRLACSARSRMALGRLAPRPLSGAASLLIAARQARRRPWERPGDAPVLPPAARPTVLADPGAPSACCAPLWEEIDVQAPSNGRLAEPHLSPALALLLATPRFRIRPRREHLRPDIPTPSPQAPWPVWRLSRIPQIAVRRIAVPQSGAAHGLLCAVTEERSFAVRQPLPASSE